MTLGNGINGLPYLSFYLFPSWIRTGGLCFKQDFTTSLVRFSKVLNTLILKENSLALLRRHQMPGE